jgi:hypothetical protein
MTTRRPPRLALALLERLVPGSASLAGDLLEQYGQRPSRWRVWREVLAAIALAWLDRTGEIRPLRLVELQPVDAIERTRQIARRARSINLSASPLPGVGGLSLAILLPLMTFELPAAWGGLGASMIGGVLLGIGMIALRSTRQRAQESQLARR